MSKNIIEKSNIAIQLHYQYVRSDIDSIRILAFQLAVANSEKNAFALSVSRRLIGSYFWRRGNCVDALSHLKYAANYFEAREDFIQSSEIYNEIGHCLQICAELKESILAYEKSIQIGTQSIDETAKFNGLLGMGKSYVMLGDTLNGVEYINKYREKSIALNKYEAASDALGYLAMIAASQKKFELSNKLYKDAYTVGIKTKSEIHKSHALTNGAIRAYNQGDYNSAKRDFIKALEIRERLHNPKAIIESYHNLGEYYLGLDSLSQAMHFFTLAMEFSEINGFMTDERDAINALLESGLSEDESFLKARLIKLEELIGEKDGLNNSLVKLLFQDDAVIEPQKNNSKDWHVWPIVFLVPILLGLFRFRNPN